jgi:hypothetical protein
MYSYVQERDFISEIVSDPNVCGTQEAGVWGHYSTGGTRSAPCVCHGVRLPVS